MRYLATAALLSGIVSFARLAAAFSNAPTFLEHSGLASSNATGDVNIALHKAVLSAAISYQGPGPDNSNATEHPENAFDGSDSTSTGKAGNIAVDLGAVYVVDSVIVKFGSTPTQYEVAWSPYLGSTPLPPTYNLATGLGSVPASETPNQEYQDVAWINDAKPIDNRTLPAQPARFLNFHFHQVYNGQWSNAVINEIEVYGHPYVPSAGDEAFLSRKKWAPTAYADAAPNGEGQTVTHAIDGELTNPWRPQTTTAPGQWYQIDLGEQVSFNQIDVVFAIGMGAGAPNSFNLFASDDAANWGAPIAQLDYGESATKPFPLQKKRYLRLEQELSNGGWWQIDELNLLAPVSTAGGGQGNPLPMADAGSIPEGGKISPNSGGMANPATGGGGSAGGGSSASDAMRATPDAGGDNPSGGSTGVADTAGDTSSTAGGCACRGSPRGDHTGRAAIWLLTAIGAYVMQATARRAKRKER